MFLETKPEGEVQVELEPWRRLMLEAADVMEKRGHCVKTEMNDQGNVCVIGALRIAGRKDGRAFHTGVQCECLNYFSAFIGGFPTVFNDTHTGQVVVSAMRACAKSRLGERFLG